MTSKIAECQKCYMKMPRHLDLMLQHWRKCHEGVAEREQRDHKELIQYILSKIREKQEKNKNSDKMNDGLEVKRELSSSTIHEKISEYFAKNANKPKSFMDFILSLSEKDFDAVSKSPQSSKSSSNGSKILLECEKCGLRAHSFPEAIDHFKIHGSNDLPKVGIPNVLKNLLDTPLLNMSGKNSFISSQTMESIRYCFTGEPGNVDKKEPAAGETCQNEIVPKSPEMPSLPSQTSVSSSKKATKPEIVGSFPSWTSVSSLEKAKKLEIVESFPSQTSVSSLEEAKKLEIVESFPSLTSVSSLEEAKKLEIVGSFPSQTSVSSSEEAEKPENVGCKPSMPRSQSVDGHLQSLDTAKSSDAGVTSPSQYGRQIILDKPPEEEGISSGEIGSQPIRNDEISNEVKAPEDKNSQNNETPIEDKVAHDNQCAFKCDRCDKEFPTRQMELMHHLIKHSNENVRVFDPVKVPSPGSEVETSSKAPQQMLHHSQTESVKSAETSGGIEDSCEGQLVIDETSDEHVASDSANSGGVEIPDSVLKRDKVHRNTPVAKGNTPSYPKHNSPKVATGFQHRPASLIPRSIESLTKTTCAIGLSKYNVIANPAIRGVPQETSSGIASISSVILPKKILQPETIADFVRQKINQQSDKTPGGNVTKLSKYALASQKNLPHSEKTIDANARKKTVNSAKTSKSKASVSSKFPTKVNSLPETTAEIERREKLIANGMYRGYPSCGKHPAKKSLPKTKKDKKLKKTKQKMKLNYLENTKPGTQNKNKEADLSKVTKSKRRLSSKEEPIAAKKPKTGKSEKEMTKSITKEGKPKERHQDKQLSQQVPNKLKPKTKKRKEIQVSLSANRKSAKKRNAKKVENNVSGVRLPAHSSRNTGQPIAPKSHSKSSNSGERNFHRYLIQGERDSEKAISNPEIPYISSGKSTSSEGDHSTENSKSVKKQRKVRRQIGRRTKPRKEFSEKVTLETQENRIHRNSITIPSFDLISSGCSSHSNDDDQSNFETGKVQAHQEASDESDCYIVEVDDEEDRSPEKLNESPDGVTYSQFAYSYQDLLAEKQRSEHAKNVDSDLLPEKNEDSAINKSQASYLISTSSSTLVEKTAALVSGFAKNTRESPPRRGNSFEAVSTMSLSETDREKMPSPAPYQVEPLNLCIRKSPLPDKMHANNSPSADSEDSDIMLTIVSPSPKKTHESDGFFRSLECTSPVVSSASPHSPENCDSETSSSPPAKKSNVGNKRKRKISSSSKKISKKRKISKESKNSSPELMEPENSSSFQNSKRNDSLYVSSGSDEEFNEPIENGLYGSSAAEHVKLHKRKSQNSGDEDQVDVRKKTKPVRKKKQKSRRRLIVSTSDESGSEEKKVRFQMKPAVQDFDDSQNEKQFSGTTKSPWDDLTWNSTAIPDDVPLSQQSSQTSKSEESEEEVQDTSSDEDDLEELDSPPHVTSNLLQCDEELSVDVSRTVSPTKQHTEGKTMNNNLNNNNVHSSDTTAACQMRYGASPDFFKSMEGCASPDHSIYSESAKSTDSEEVIPKSMRKKYEATKCSNMESVFRSQKSRSSSTTDSSLCHLCGKVVSHDQILLHRHWMYDCLKEKPNNNRQ